MYFYLSVKIQALGVHALGNGNWMFGDSWSCVFFGADSSDCRTFLFCARGDGLQVSNIIFSVTNMKGDSIMLKKQLCMLFVFFFLISMCACSSKQTSSSNNTPIEFTEAEEETSH